MLAALLLAGAAPVTAADAERAFAADAKAIGQWSAFRKWAADDAVIFVPQPTNAQAFLKPLKDPPKAVHWWPTASFVSCDGKMAVNTGGAAWPDGHASYFSTVWKQAGGTWRWALDHGDNLETPRPRVPEPAVRRAACSGTPASPPGGALASSVADGTGGSGRSPDQTLFYAWRSDANGRSLRAWLWNGTGWDDVLNDRVGAAKP